MSGFRRLFDTRTKVLKALLSSVFAQQQLQDCLANQAFPDEVHAKLRTDVDKLWIATRKLDGRTLDEWNRIKPSEDAPQRKGLYALGGALVGAAGGAALTAYAKNKANTSTATATSNTTGLTNEEFKKFYTTLSTATEALTEYNSFKVPNTKPDLGIISTMYNNILEVNEDNLILRAEINEEGARLQRALSRVVEVDLDHKTKYDRLAQVDDDRAERAKLTAELEACNRHNASLVNALATSESLRMNAQYELSIEIANHQRTQSALALSLQQLATKGLQLDERDREIQNYRSVVQDCETKFGQQQGELDQCIAVCASERSRAMELQSAYLQLRAESDQTERELQLALQRVVSIDLECKEQLERAQLTADSTREQATRQVERNCAEHVQSLVMALASLQAQLFEADREQKELEAWHDRTQQELQKALQRVASLDLECKEKETQLKTAQREAVAIHEQAISSLRSEAERTQSLVSALASLQAQLLESDREQKELEAWHDRTQQELQKALQRVTYLDLECKEKETRLKNSEAVIQQAISAARNEVAEHTQSLITALASLQAQLFEADRERKEIEAEKERTQQELQKALQRVASLDLECKEKETQLKNSAAAIQQQATSAAINEVESNCAERTQSLVVALTSLQAQLLESDRERKEVEAEHDRTQQELQKALQRVASLDLECKEKETQLKNSEATAHEQTISALRSEAERTQSLVAALASLQAQLFESDRERKEIEAGQDRTQQELQKALQRVASLDLECKEKETQLKNAEATAHERAISALSSEAESSFYQRTQALQDALASLQAQLLESDRDRKEIEAEHEVTLQELQKALQRVASLDLECKQRETVEKARALDIETHLRAMAENNVELEARLATRDADCEAAKQDLERVKAEHKTEHDQAIGEVRRNYSDALASFQAQLLESDRDRKEIEAEHERTQQELHNALQRVVDLDLELRDQKSNIAIGKYVTKTSREKVPEFSERLAALSACQEPDEKCGQRFFQYQQDTDDHRDITHARKLFTKLAMLTKDVCELDEPKRKRTRKQTEFYGQD